MTFYVAMGIPHVMSFQQREYATESATRELWLIDYVLNFLSMFNIQSPDREIMLSCIVLLSSFQMMNGHQRTFNSRLTAKLSFRDIT